MIRKEKERKKKKKNIYGGINKGLMVVVEKHKKRREEMTKKGRSVLSLFTSCSRKRQTKNIPSSTQIKQRTNSSSTSSNHFRPNLEEINWVSINIFSFFTLDFSKTKWVVRNCFLVFKTQHCKIKKKKMLNLITISFFFLNTRFPK